MKSLLHGVLPRELWGEEFKAKVPFESREKKKPYTSLCIRRGQLWGTCPTEALMLETRAGQRGVFLFPSHPCSPWYGIKGGRE